MRSRNRRQAVGLQRSFAEVVIQGRPGLTQEARELVPVFEPGLQFVHHGTTVRLMELQACFRRERFWSCLASSGRRLSELPARGGTRDKSARPRRRTGLLSALVPSSLVSMRIVRRIAAAEVASELKTGCFDQRQASVKVARPSILEAIWDQRTEGDASCESFRRE